MDENLTRVALVCGATNEEGRTTALALAGLGMHLALNDLNPMRLDALEAEIQATGGQSKIYVEDITKSMPTHLLINQIVADFGRIDVVVNCSAAQPRQSILELDEWDWHRSLDVNLTSTYLLVQAVVKPMQNQAGGLIIASGPVDKQTRSGGNSAYLAGKSGLMALVQAAAPELIEARIGITGIESDRLTWQPSDGALNNESPHELSKLIPWLCGMSLNRITGKIYHYNPLKSA